MTDKTHFNEENPTIDDDYLFAASCYDCTGLIPSLARDEDEAESYEEIYPYLPPIPPNPVLTTPDVPRAEGIRAEIDDLDTLK